MIQLPVQQSPKDAGRASPKDAGRASPKDAGRATAKDVNQTKYGLTKEANFTILLKNGQKLQILKCI